MNHILLMKNVLHTTAFSVEDDMFYEWRNDRNSREYRNLGMITGPAFPYRSYVAYAVISRGISLSMFIRVFTSNRIRRFLRRSHPYFLHTIRSMISCIDTDSGHSTLFEGLKGHLCTRPLSTFASRDPTPKMVDPVVLDFVRKTFFISGYTLFYLIALFAAGAIGRAGAYVAEKWILERFISDRIKANRDYVEVSTELCVLLCSTGFLIVAVGLLFMHLVGGLPHEYDELAVQIGIAFFGLIVFVCLTLAALLFACCVWSVGKALRGLWRKEIVDEEAGLFGKRTASNYGTSKISRRRSVTPVTSEGTPEQADGEHIAPRSLDRTWIKMKVFSSVRNLDVRRIGCCSE